MFSLENKTALITGAAGDLGFAISKGYVGAGATVVLVGRDEKNLLSATHTLSAHGGRATAFACDVSDPEQVDVMFGSLARSVGPIDILVTAAGVQHRSPALRFDHREWDRVLRTNLNGTFYCAQAAAKQMVPRKHGRVIMISSLTAEIGIPNIAAYAASRGAIRQLGRTLAVEWAPFGITVNCIGPGRFHTNMTADVFANASKRAAFLAAIPMGRAGVPDDLCGLSIFLASDASSYLTGQSIYVDGGWLAGGGNIAG